MLFLDGHRGRFDPTRSPQYFHPSKPHLPFIQRADKGSMSEEEVECIPLYSVWECSAFPSENKGYVQDEYWDGLVDRADTLQRRARNRREATNCATFPGFVDAYPGSLSIERNSRFPGRMDFDDMVQLLSGIQGELRALAAWVRMADALISTPFSGKDVVTDRSIPWKSHGSLMGLWINNTPENVATWYLKLEVPVFVCHEIKGSPDRPASYKGMSKVSDALDLCNIQQSNVAKEWLRLYRRTNGDDSESWQEDFVSGTHLSLDKLERWRSSSNANRTNFPGEDWGEITETPMEVEDDPLLPERPSLAPAPPGYEPYIMPPPVESPNLRAKIRHYMDDHNDQGERCFKYVDRHNRRYLHMDSRLFILPEIVHPVEIFGLLGPRLKFYNDFHCRVRARSSFWVYEKELPSPGD
ncbi:hypothetical protein EV360DRAFT_77228, partial [Lentinula raphanica]